MFTAEITVESTTKDKVPNHTNTPGEGCTPKASTVVETSLVKVKLGVQDSAEDHTILAL